MPTPTVLQPTSRAKLASAFAAVYVIWGSTYLAIRFAIETIPPLFMAGIRFSVAGAVVYAAMRLAGAAPPTRRNWRDAAVVGAALLLGGNGGVVWAEQYIASGIAALLVATVPIWMVGLDWLLGTGPRPLPQTVVGMALGLLGMGVLVGPDALHGGALLPSLVLVAASIAWAWGSLYSRGAEPPASPMMGTAMQMSAGGALLLVAGVVRGELGGFDVAAVSGKSFLALVYLIVAGAIVGFSCYIWLLRHARPAQVSTYAYVNPIVAVLLGWALAGEPLTPRIAAAGAIIVVGVALIVTARGKRLGGRSPAGEPAD